MSINTTPFLHLPQWTAEEKPSFLAEINQSYASIDAGVRANQLAVEAAQTAAEAAKNQADEAVEKGHVNASALVTLQQDLNNLEANYNSAGGVYIVNLELQTLNNFFKNPPSATLILNKYTSFINVEGLINGGDYNSETGTVPIAKITSSMPVTTPHLSTFSNLITPVTGGAAGNIVKVVFNNNWTISLVGNSFNFTDGKAFYTFGSFPVTTITPSRASMIDNCLYIAPKN